MSSGQAQEAFRDPNARRPFLRSRRWRSRSAETQNPIGPSLPIEPDSYIAADLSHDGSRLFAASLTRRAVRWDIAPEVWKRHACHVAGRELTHSADRGAASAHRTR